MAIVKLFRNLEIFWSNYKLILTNFFEYNLRNDLVRDLHLFQEQLFQIVPCYTQDTVGTHPRLSRAVYYNKLVALCFIGLYQLLKFLRLSLDYCTHLLLNGLMLFFTWLHGEEYDLWKIKMDYQLMVPDKLHKASS